MRTPAGGGTPARTRGFQPGFPRSRPQLLSSPSPVEVLLRGLAEEARLAGAPLDREALLRRFPAHRELIGELAARPAPGAAPAETPAVPVPGRRDPRGTIVPAEGGGFRISIPRDQLAGRNPASEYLARAARLAGAAVPGVQTPAIDDSSPWEIVVHVPPLPNPGTAAPAGLHGEESRKVLQRVVRVAARLEALHERGAAHGRLDETFLWTDPATGKWILGTGLEAGPGLDRGTLREQQTADLRALGAMLYTGLAREGTARGVQDVLARFDRGRLVPLAGRRPDLHPGVARLTDQALGAGLRKHGLPSVAAFRLQLRRLLNLETGNQAFDSRVRSAGSIARWLPALPVLALLAWGVFGLPGGDSHARLSDGGRADGQALIELREAIERNDLDAARRSWLRLQEEMESLPPEAAFHRADREASTRSAAANRPESPRGGISGR